MQPREPLKDRTNGRWLAILPACGVDTMFLRNKHGPCPLCGGKDRFRFDDKGGDGTWICNKCGAGDGIELVKRVNCCDFKAAAQLIEQDLAEAPVSARGRPPKSDVAIRDALAKLWTRSNPIKPADPVGLYLSSRCGLTEFPAKLRFAADERYVDNDGPASWHPVMVAKIDPSDEAAAKGDTAALHRTFLTGDGRKADVPLPRKMLGSMPRGAAVRLMPATETLGIAEGIETALSAAALYDVPCWAALTAGLLEEWTPPQSVRSVFVFGDNDASATGQAAAWKLTQRLRAKGIDVLVEFPPRVGDDWNDVHTRKLETA